MCQWHFLFNDKNKMFVKLDYPHNWADEFPSPVLPGVPMVAVHPSDNFSTGADKVHPSTPAIYISSPSASPNPSSKISTPCSPSAIFFAIIMVAYLGRLRDTGRMREYGCYQSVQVIVLLASEVEWTIPTIKPAREC